jgi:DNA-binding Lrp family transcriptional regulator
LDKALVLLTLEPNEEPHVLDSIKKLNSVLESHLLYGPYDAYVLVEAKDRGKLHNIIIDDIRKIEGINSTMTCFIAE